MSGERRPDPAILEAYRHAELPGDDTPWREASFSVVDLETTGLDPARDEIISFAAVTVEGGRVRLADAVYELIRPKQMPGGDTIRIHGLRRSELAGAKELSQVLGRMLEAMSGRIVVAHVAQIEEGFLGAALEAHGAALRGPIVDTAAMAAPQDGRVVQGVAGRRAPIGLSELARSLNLPVHRPHHADGDALTTAQVFIALATHLEAAGDVSVGSLRRISRPAPRRRSLAARAGRALSRRLPGAG